MSESPISRLKIFIEAAEMIGGDDWTPTQQQWRSIRNKIMDLPEETGPILNHSVPPSGPIYRGSPEPLMPISHPSTSPLFGGSDPVVSQVPPAPMSTDPSLNSGNPQVPTKLRVNPDGTSAPAFL